MIFEDAGWRFVLFLLGTGSSIYLVNILLRKIFGVERKEFFSDNRVNEAHKKWDRIANGLSAVIVFIMSFAIYEYGPAASLYLLLITVALGLVQVLVRAGFEKKYAENPNEYLYTLFESLTTAVIIVTFGVSLLPEMLPYIFDIQKLKEE